jgi:hypothetical protein
MEYYSTPPPPPPPLPPSAQPQKDRTLLNILMAGCGCLVVIGIIAGLFFGRVFSFTNQPKKTVQNQIDAINEGNYRLAYSYFSGAYQRTVDISAFRDGLKPFAAMIPIKEVNLSSVNIRNNRALVEGTLGGANGVIFPIRYELLRENHEWKILRYEWTPPGDLQAV